MNGYNWALFQIHNVCFQDRNDRLWVSDSSTGLLDLIARFLWDPLRALCGGVEGWERLEGFCENFYGFSLILL